MQAKTNKPEFWGGRASVTHLRVGGGGMGDWMGFCAAVFDKSKGSSD